MLSHLRRISGDIQGHRSCHCSVHDAELVHCLFRKNLSEVLAMFPSRTRPHFAAVLCDQDVHLDFDQVSGAADETATRKQTTTRPWLLSRAREKRARSWWKPGLGRASSWARWTNLAASSQASYIPPPAAATTTPSPAAPTTPAKPSAAAAPGQAAAPGEAEAEAAGAGAAAGGARAS